MTRFSVPTDVRVDSSYTKPRKAPGTHHYKVTIRRSGEEVLRRLQEGEEAARAPSGNQGSAVPTLVLQLARAANGSLHMLGCQSESYTGTEPLDRAVCEKVSS